MRSTFRDWEIRSADEPCATVAAEALKRSIVAGPSEILRLGHAVVPISIVLSNLAGTRGFKLRVQSSKPVILFSIRIIRILRNMYTSCSLLSYEPLYLHLGIEFPVFVGSK
jgi:hypothetical protein